MLAGIESCVINGGHATKYFSLQRRAPQEDPISVHLIIPALDVLFALIKPKKDVSGLNIFGHEFLYVANADDTTFFVKDFKSNGTFYKDSWYSYLM